MTGSGPLACQPGALENVRYMTGREMPSMGQQTTSTTTGVQPPPPGTDIGNQNKFDSMSEAVKTSAAIPQGFKDLIGKRCEERGILWRPVPGKFKEGKPIYLCGVKQVYLDRNVIFVLEKAVWVPCSLNSLLDKAFDGT